LSKHKLLIDCAKKSVKLTTLDGKKIEFVAEPVITSKGVANRTEANQLDASQGLVAPVVSEFPDVFLKELSGIPPDRDIKFVIKLILGTAPIYKSPYRMVTLELTDTTRNRQMFLNQKLRNICL
jgi:hypothetical protein